MAFSITQRGHHNVRLPAARNVRVVVFLEFDDSGLICIKRPRAAAGIMDNLGSALRRARRYRIGKWHEWFQSEQ